ncbi:MAG: oxidoreductase [Candidatus Levybacteria bacterium CG10_big_fil_rev_8_21_14_0_10_35_13]|nr:MAG: oxidoreductase [Candidatus Levybacteria bacterium CG10_big_fil_rev_8_21_14_0_10_35_13]
MSLKNKHSKINVAVVGLGYWGPNLLRNFLDIKDYKVVYGCDLDKKNLEKYSSIYPSIKFINNFDEIIKDKNVDLVAIATPLSTHFRLAEKALKAGKHVLLEKPMTQNSKEASRLVKLAKRNNKILMVGYTFVYSEPIKKIKEILNKKEIGQIYYYDSTRINLGLIQNDVNVIWDLACHDFSIINYLFNKVPVAIQAFGSKFVNSRNEEIAHVIIKYDKNFTAHINVSWLSPVKIRIILIGGSKKMITFDDISPNEKIRIYNKSVDLESSQITPFKPAYRSGDVIIPYLEQNESLKNELLHLAYCIKNNKKPITSGEEGLKILKMLEASDISLKINKPVMLRH